MVPVSQVQKYILSASSQNLNTNSYVEFKLGEVSICIHSLPFRTHRSNYTITLTTL